MLLYNLAIRSYAAFITLGSLFNPKAKLWVKGRKNWESRLQQHIQAAGIQKPLWFHCASLGEFEQGRPLIEAVKKEFPGHPVLLTFFSPSGYEVRKDYKGADVIAYLPLDTRRNAKRFLEIAKPAMAVFVKYEFWLNYLFALQRASIPTFLVSAVFMPHQPFFKWYGGNFRRALNCYQTIFTQDEASLKLLEMVHVKTAVVAGDTRFDRVLEICAAPKELSEVRDFTAGAFTIIGGSTWAKDEQFLLAAYAALRRQHPHLKLLIAPHEIDQANIERLWNLIGAQGLSSRFITDEPDASKDVIIINTMGYLSSIYQYAQVAVVGGGFDDGIHNILEPSVFGLPVLFGPNYHKFNEAEDLLELEGAFSFGDGKALQNRLSLLIGNQQHYAQASAQARRYVRDHAGATGKIITQLKPLL